MRAVCRAVTDVITTRDFVAEADARMASSLATAETPEQMAAVKEAWLKERAEARALVEVQKVAEEHHYYVGDVCIETRHVTRKDADFGRVKIGDEIEVGGAPPLREAEP